MEPTCEQIDELRKLFFDKLEKEGAPCEEGFHPLDIDRIRNHDFWLRKFLQEKDLNMKASFHMLWTTCVWRKEYGANDISANNINIEYMNSGISYCRNRDRDGKKLFICHSKLHVKGLRNPKELLRCFVYWLERLNREENYDKITLIFDMSDTGFVNMDIEYTKSMIDILKYYYPFMINYILIYDLPWILTAAFKIIKALLPAKAVEIMRFINSKTISEFVSEENMLTCWGGKDDYVFTFEPETILHNSTDNNNNNHQNHNGYHSIPNGHTKKVHFANLTDTSPMNDMDNHFGKKDDGSMLVITPPETITFAKTGNELSGTLEIFNSTQIPLTYKIKTTSPEKYRVRPSSGILPPAEMAIINVVFQQGQIQSTLNKDKFLVMCMQLNNPKDINLSAVEIAEMWKNTPPNKISVEQHRLKCDLASHHTQNGDLQRNGKTDIFGDGGHGGGFTGDGDDIRLERISSTVSELKNTVHRLESQIKFNHFIQWGTIFLCLILSIAIIYILKIELKIDSQEYCMRK